MSEPARIDWFRVLTDLKRAGLSLQFIADCVGVGKTTVVAWKNWHEPSHSSGERLVDFWCKTTGKPRSDLPIEQEMVGILNVTAKDTRPV